VNDRFALYARTILGLFAVVGLLASLPVRAELNCNAGIEFHADGGIKRCNLNGHHTLHTAKGDRLTCMNGHALVKYPDGRLQSCTLLEPTMFDDVPCAAQSRVELDHDGHLLRCNQG